MLGVQIQNLKLYVTRLKFSQTLLIQQLYIYITKINYENWDDIQFKL